MESADFGRQVHRVQQATLDTFGFPMRPNQVQTSRIMMTRSIAELDTGEGKTLAAVIAISLLARDSSSVMVCTANDYLAQRDAHLLRPIYERLGLTCAVVTSSTTRDQRRRAYRCNITYGTIREFGFDYLRDCLSQRQRTDAAIQQPPQCLVADEADSLLIDEARSPLIISGPQDASNKAMQACYQWAACVATEFRFHSDYVAMPVSGMIALTRAGRSRVYQLAMPDAMQPLAMTDILHAIERAIYVNHRFRPDKHYLVRDGKIVIIDEFTGRTSDGRSWSEGLHQAIEAREGLSLTNETRPIAQVTVQEYVKRFPTLCGMTGTAVESRRELQALYGLNVSRIDPHQPSRRRSLPNIVCTNRSQKLAAITDETQGMLAAGRAVLIGTRTVEQSQELADVLQHNRIESQILNASNPERESAIIAQAGQAARVTVATNMAGRGTDIVLSDKVRTAGGLHVIGTELHAAARIDRQLAGRCARCGDPGSFRQFMALDDEILTSAWGTEGAAAIARRYRSGDDASIQHAARLFHKAQRAIERRNAEDRRAMMARHDQLAEMYQSLGLDPVLDRFTSTLPPVETK